MCQFISHAQLWDVGGNQSPWRKPSQMWGQRAHSTDSGPSWQWFFFLFNIIRKWQWPKWHCSGTCYILLWVIWLNHLGVLRCMDNITIILQAASSEVVTQLLSLKVALIPTGPQIHIWAEWQLVKYSGQYLNLRPVSNTTTENIKYSLLVLILTFHLFLCLSLHNFLIKKLVIHIIQQF